MDNNWNVRLKETRIKVRQSLKEVSNSIGITQQSLIEYEAGRVYPKIDFLVKLCEEYGVTLNYIVYGSNSSLSFDLDKQKIIEVLSCLYLKEKMIFNRNDHYFKLKDNEIALYMKYIVDFLDCRSKLSLKSTESVINFIKKIN